MKDWLNSEIERFYWTEGARFDADGGKNGTAMKGLARRGERNDCEVAKGMKYEMKNWNVVT